MKKEETKQFIRWCILGAVGCGFMAAGDWLLGWERSGLSLLQSARIVFC